MTKNHSQWRQPSPRHTLSLRCSFFLHSPLLPFLPLQMSLSLQMLFGKLSPVHIHSYLLLSLLRRCCLALSYPSPSPSSSSFSPLRCFSSSPPLHSLSLASPSLIHQILFVSPSALSPNFPTSLHPPFLLYLPHFPSTHTQLFKLSISLLFFFFPSILLLSSHPDISSRCFLDRDDLSCSDNET